MSVPVITAFRQVPGFAKGLVRDVRARWAFEEVGQPYEVRLLEHPEIKTQEHRALQPFGQLPTYSDDEVELFESGAIALRIAERGEGLLPADEAGRARATQWLIAALNSVEPMIFDLIAVDIFNKEEEWAKLRRPSAVEALRTRLGDLSEALGDSEWLDGDFTVADLIMVAVLRQLRHTDLVAEHPNLAAYVARGEARPAFKQALADHMAAFAEEAVPA